jgi:hypothetical protein
VPKWDKVTPALYAITKKVAQTIIAERWDGLIAPILVEERKIYERALDTFAFTQNIGHNAASALVIFITLLKNEGINFDQEIILSALLDVYWDLAEDEQYWQLGKYAELAGRIPYEAALIKWEAGNQHRIQWCEEKLPQWLNAN